MWCNSFKYYFKIGYVKKDDINCKADDKVNKSECVETWKKYFMVKNNCNRKNSKNV